MSNTWKISNIKKMIGRGIGDPDALTYPDAIKDHFIEAIESLAEDIVALADIHRQLTDAERQQYAEVINISENEIYPMITEFTKLPAYSNNVASFAITNANFLKVIKVRDIFVDPQNAKRYTFIKVYSMKEFIGRSMNPHLVPREGEIMWLNLGNKIHVYSVSGSSGSSGSIDSGVSLWFHCLVSLDYDSWKESTSREANLQTLGFGTNFLTKAIEKATYTMKLQLGLEKE